MKGLWLKGRDLTLRTDLPEPAPADGELLLQVKYAGICGTDFELQNGYSNFEGTPGHEFVANVLEGPEGWPGKRVVVDINVACGECEMCKRGRKSHCVFRHVLGIRGRAGAFAERLTVPVRNAYELPDTVPDEIGVLVEPLAAAFEILEQVSISDQERVLVIGAGRLGRLVASVMKDTGAEVDVHVRSPVREEDFVGLMVNCVTRPNGIYDVVIDCTGSPDGFAIATGCIRPLGTIVLKSTFAKKVEVDTSELVINEITIIGSRCGPFPVAIESLVTGRIDLSGLSFERYTLEDYKMAFTRARSRNIYKVLLEPGGGAT